VRRQFCPCTLLVWLDQVKSARSSPSYRRLPFSSSAGAVPFPYARTLDPHGFELATHRSELEPYRDEAGFLPLVPCSKCGTLLIGRVSHKEGSKGKRFYKCPLLEHVSCGGIASLFWMRFFVDFFISGLQTDYACRTYYFEEHYVPLLVSKGVLPRHFSQLRGRDGMGLEVMKDGKDMLKACQGVDACQELMESAVIHLKDSEALLKALVDSNSKLMTKMDKIGERLLVVGAVKVFILVLVLLVLLVK